MEPSPLQPHEMRTSDADRDRVAAILGEALAEGRLSPEEHAERIDALYSSKTFGELQRLTRDLPAQSSSAAPAPMPAVAGPQPVALGPASSAVTAIFGGATRAGRWTVPSHLVVTAVFGGVELDLREAILEQREVTIIVNCLFGGVEITVPEGVDVEDSGSAIFGGRDATLPSTGQPDAPMIHLKGVALFGGVSVKRKRTKRPLLPGRQET